MIEGKICRFDRVLFAGREPWRVVSSFRAPDGERVFVLERWLRRKCRHDWNCEREYFLRNFYERRGRSPRRKER